MDPNTGRVYASTEAAKLAGVEQPVPVTVEETEDNYIVEGPDVPGQMILAINRTRSRGEIYAGSVPFKEIQRRRNRNKMAKKTRRNQRRNH